MARASAFQAEGYGFEPRLPLNQAIVAQSVERILGKDEVTGSIPVDGSRKSSRAPEQQSNNTLFEDLRNQNRVGFRRERRPYNGEGEV